MTTLKKTEIIAVIDRSGSMAAIRADAEGGFNNFVTEQQKVPGDARLSLVQFDDHIETVYAGKALADVPPYKLEPRGSTALLDAIGMAMDNQGERIRSEGWADLVVLVIVTDGGENSSREYTRSRIKSMITHAEEHGWQVIYLGANQDAFANASSMGIKMHNTANYSATAQGTTSAYYSASTMTGNLRAGIGGQSLQNLVDSAPSNPTVGPTFIVPAGPAAPLTTTPTE